MGFWGRCCLLWHSFTVCFLFFLSNFFVHHSVDSILCLGLFLCEATHKGQERFYKGFSCCKHCQDGISADFLQFIQFKLTAWLHSPPLQIMCNPETLTCCGHCSCWPEYLLAFSNTYTMSHLSWVTNCILTVQPSHRCASCDVLVM